MALPLKSLPRKTLALTLALKKGTSKKIGIGIDSAILPLLVSGLNVTFHALQYFVIFTVELGRK